MTFNGGQACGRDVAAIEACRGLNEAGLGCGLDVMVEIPDGSREVVCSSRSSEDLVGEGNPSGNVQF